jgi:hypothetical protein
MADCRRSGDLKDLIYYLLIREEALKVIASAAIFTGAAI